uniref:Cyclic nucleotide-binding domain-containing protein n=1 Tax=Palpitomonas bilix TaxID=652834 RepID=A0A7S3G230_9EUKA
MEEGREWNVKPGESATHHLQLRLDQTQHGVRMNARGAATVRALVEPGRRLDEIFRKNMEKSPHSARLYNEVQKAVEKKNKEALEMFEDNHALYFPILVSRGLTMSANAFDREVRSIVSRGSDMKSGGGVGSAGKSGSSVGGGGDLQSRGGRMRGGGRMNGAKSMPALSKKKVALPHLQTEQACLTCIPSSSNLSPRFSSAIASTPTPSSLLSHRSRMQVENQLHKLETAESVFEVDRVGPGSVIGVGEVFTKAPGRCTSAVADGRVEVVRITKWDLLRNFTREESNFLLGLIGAWEHSLLTGDIDEELLDLAASRWEWGEIRKNVLQQAVEDKKIEKAAKTPLPKLR